MGVLFDIAGKLLLLSIVLSVLELAVSVRYAFADDAGSCYTVADGDARAYCLAKAHKQPSYCYSIQAASMRSQCLAEVRK